MANSTFPERTPFVAPPAEPWDESLDLGCAVPEPGLRARFNPGPGVIFIDDPRLPLTPEQAASRERYEAFALAAPSLVDWQAPAWQVALLRAASRLSDLKSLVL